MVDNAALNAKWMGRADEEQYTILNGIDCVGVDGENLFQFYCTFICATDGFQNKSNGIVST